MSIYYQYQFSIFSGFQFYIMIISYLKLIALIITLAVLAIKFFLHE